MKKYGKSVLVRFIYYRQTSWKLRQYCAGNYNKYINLISSGENEVEWWKINENSFVVIWEAIVERVPIPEEDDEVSYDSKDDNEEDENYACSHHDSGSPKR